MDGVDMDPMEKGLSLCPEKKMLTTRGLSFLFSFTPTFILQHQHV